MSVKPVVGAMLLFALVGRAVHAADAPPPAAAKPSCCQGAAGETAAANGLDAKVAAMNAADGAAKIEAMAALLTELVAQHKAVHQQGGCCGGACPMMQGKPGHRSHDGTAAPTGDAAP
jgi:hypothetical protein